MKSEKPNSEIEDNYIDIDLTKFDHADKIEEVVSLLNYAPVAYLSNIREKLLAYKNLSELDDDRVN